ncbi:MAG TPA: MnhB domain-containing protein, partial [Thermosynergistes sp.]|nr:MnhB domain-containing protein [Thermosynergistes sp.]
TFIAFLLVAHGGKRLLGWVKEGLFSAAESTGLLIFLGAGLFGISTTFFYNFLAKKGGLFGSVVPLGSNPGVLNSSGTIALMNLAVGLEVVAGLSFIIVYMFKGIRIELEGEEENHDR